MSSVTENGIPIRSIEMFGHSSALAMNPFKTHLPRTCHLSRIPQEVRDLIYEMLPTTPYCTNLNATGSALRFQLHTAILLVNKQVSAEAMRVLYQRNQFITLKTSGVGIDLTKVPRFRLLTKKSSASSYCQSASHPAPSAAPRVLSPVLQIEIAVADSSRIKLMSSLKITTTLEGLQSIIAAIWKFDDCLHSHSSGYVYHKDLSLTLNYKFKAASRHHSMSELALKPWDRIHGLKEIVLNGDIEEPMREHLKKFNLEGPFPDEVAMQLAGYYSLAEQGFERKDYSAARWWCNLSDNYWNHILFLGPYHPEERRRRWQEGNELWNVMRKLDPMFDEMRLKLVKACLRQSKYDAAIPNAEEAISGKVHFVANPRPSPVMKIKFLLSACLAHIALTAQFAHTSFVRAMNGEKALDKASRTLHEWSLNNNMHAMEITEDLITKDLRMTVANELIRLKSSHRCSRGWPVSLTRQEGPDWQVGKCQRSFWEWLELPENWKLVFKMEL